MTALTDALCEIHRELLAQTWAYRHHQFRHLDRRLFESWADSILDAAIALGTGPAAGVTDPVMDAFNRRNELRLASEKMPEPTEEAIAYTAHILSEWLDDAAPLHERRYREPARAVLKFAAHLAGEH